MRLLPFSLLSLGLAVGVIAAPSWVAPQGGFECSIGGQCSTAWNNTDPGDWTNVQIDLMTGPDHLRRAISTVATNVDMTKDNTWDFDCPVVDTTGQKIYFYRMARIDTTDGESSRLYTERFCILNGDDCNTPDSGWGRGYINGTRMSIYHQSPTSVWD